MSAHNGSRSVPPEEPGSEKENEGAEEEATTMAAAMGRGLSGAYLQLHRTWDAVGLSREEQRRQWENFVHGSMEPLLQHWVRAHRQAERDVVHTNDLLLQKMVWLVYQLREQPEGDCLRALWEAIELHHTPNNAKAMLLIQDVEDQEMIQNSGQKPSEPVSEEEDSEEEAGLQLLPYHLGEGSLLASSGNTSVKEAKKRLEAKKAPHSRSSQRRRMSYWQHLKRWLPFFWGKAAATTPSTVPSRCETDATAPSHVPSEVSSFSSVVIQQDIEGALQRLTGSSHRELFLLLVDEVRRLQHLMHCRQLARVILSHQSVLWNGQEAFATSQVDTDTASISSHQLQLRKAIECSRIAIALHQLTVLKEAMECRPETIPIDSILLPLPLAEEQQPLMNTMTKHTATALVRQCCQGEERGAVSGWRGDAIVLPPTRLSQLMRLVTTPPSSPGESSAAAAAPLTHHQQQEEEGDGGWSSGVPRPTVTCWSDASSMKSSRLFASCKERQSTTPRLPEPPAPNPSSVLRTGPQDELGLLLEASAYREATEDRQRCSYQPLHLFGSVPPPQPPRSSLERGRPSSGATSLLVLPNVVAPRSGAPPQHDATSVEVTSMALQRHLRHTETEKKGACSVAVPDPLEEAPAVVSPFPSLHYATLHLPASLEAQLLEAPYHTTSTWRSGRTENETQANATSQEASAAPPPPLAEACLSMEQLLGAIQELDNSLTHQLRSAVVSETAQFRALVALLEAEWQHTQHLLKEVEQRASGEEKPTCGEERAQTFMSSPATGMARVMDLLTAQFEREFQQWEKKDYRFLAAPVVDEAGGLLCPSEVPVWWAEFTAQRRQLFGVLAATTDASSTSAMNELCVVPALQHVVIGASCLATAVRRYAIDSCEAASTAMVQQYEKVLQQMAVRLTEVHREYYSCCGGGPSTRSSGAIGKRGRPVSPPPPLNLELRLIGRCHGILVAPHALGASPGRTSGSTPEQLAAAVFAPLQRWIREAQVEVRALSEALQQLERRWSIVREVRPLLQQRQALLEEQRELVVEQRRGDRLLNKKVNMAQKLLKEEAARHRAAKVLPSLMQKLEHLVKEWKGLNATATSTTPALLQLPSTPLCVDGQEVETVLQNHSAEVLAIGISVSDRPHRRRATTLSSSRTVSVAPLSYTPPSRSRTPTPVPSQTTEAGRHDLLPTRVQAAPAGGLPATPPFRPDGTPPPTKRARHATKKPSLSSRRRSPLAPSLSPPPLLRRASPLSHNAGPAASPGPVKPQRPLLVRSAATPPPPPSARSRKPGPTRSPTPPPLLQTPPSSQRHPQGVESNSLTPCSCGQKRWRATPSPSAP